MINLLGERNANAIAIFLERHPAVKRVTYPGLPSHPQYELAKRQQHGFGSMVTFYLHGGRSEAGILLRKVWSRMLSPCSQSFMRQCVLLYNVIVLPLTHDFV